MSSDITQPDINGQVNQLNMADARVARWYDQAAKHSDSGKCTNDETCRGCKALEFRRRQLRETPGLLV